MKNKSFPFLAVLFCFFAGRVNAISDGSIEGRRGVCVGTVTTTLTSSYSGTWTSSNTSVATVVTISGTMAEVTGVAAGTATITHHTSTLEAAVVRVIAPGSPFALTPPHLGYVCVGAPWTVNAPSGGTWWSDDNGIVTATRIPNLLLSNENATIEGQVAGPVTTYVHCEFPGGCEARALIKIGLPDIVGEADLCIGEVSDPRLGCSTGDTWTSDNPAIAAFLDEDESGLLTGVSVGTTTVTYTHYADCVETRVVNISAGSSISGTTSVCVGQTTALSCSPSGGTWSSANTSVATVGISSGVVTGVSAGTAVISYFPSEGCPSVVVVTVNSNPAPITGVLGVCVGGTTTLSNSVSGGTWGSSNTSKATVNSSGVVTGIAAGTAMITYTVSGGCYTSVMVTVVTSPAITGPNKACVGQTMTLNGTPSGGTWSINSTTYATINETTGTVTGVSWGSFSTATITYTLGTGCVATKTITVESVPTIGTAWGEVCIGNVIDYSLSGTFGSHPGTMTWSSSNTSVATIDGTGTVDRLTTGTTVISYTNSNGCYATKQLTVYTYPEVSGSLSICHPGTTTLSAIPSGGTWLETSSNISVGLTSGIVTSVATGTAIVTYSLFANRETCKKKVTVTVGTCGGKAQGTTTENGALKNRVAYTVMPNPSNGDLIIQGTSLTPGNITIKAKVINVIGQVVYNDDIDLTNGTCKLSIKDAMTGIYLLHITDEKGATSTFKLVIQN